MKFKKSLFILILAVFLISIAGVCASDVNDTAVASQDDAVMESTDENMITVEDIEPALNTAENEEIVSAGVDDEIVGVENEEILSAGDDEIEGAENDLDVLSADSAKYSDLANEVGSGGNIKLKHKYYTYDSGYIMITQSNSVIDGNGAIIDMTGTNIFAFYIDYRALGTTIKNLTIKNSGASEGSAVYAWSHCTIENCSFINNQAWDNGGAVFFRLSGKVINCYFESNRVTGSNGTGGAVYFGGSGEVINCSFNGNRADGSGAVYIAGNGSVINSTFVNNSANKFGGACFCYDFCDARNCTFVNNSANKTGGAILFFAKGNAINCSFINNTANQFGGACFCYDFCDARNCTFVNNSGDYGGALHFVKGQVIDCNFTNNHAAGDGGAIYGSGESNVANCNFINNIASRDGGAIDIEANGNVRNCTFVKNTADRYAGALLIYDSNVTNCKFVNNTAATDGGALLIGEDGVITNGTFVNNSATNENGGAIIIYGNAIVTNCILTYNTAGNYGGALLIYDNATVTNCTFVNNSATNEGGGALYLQSRGIVENCNFTDNSAYFGAALALNNDAFTVKHCNFVNNFASLGAGAVIGSGDIINCNFVNNIASRDGGAIIFDAKGNAINCSFTGNNALFGGAIFWRYTGNIEVAPANFISGCVFVNNSADNGIIYSNCTSGFNHAINNNIFLNNDGVAIYFVKSDSTSNVDYNWFGNNATNYDIEPITNNAEMSTWLFLNATANPDAIPIFDSSEIMFKLYAYAPSGVSEFDNSLLKAINLTLTPTNGNVNITEVGLDEPVRFNPEDYGICKLTAKIENVKYTTTLEISDGTSFFDLNFVINGNDNDTIILDRDYTYNSTFDYNLNEGIVINRPLTIVGNGHTLNATALARIFSIQANNVVIENITFVNGKTDRHGGAIFWSGNNANISDCIFVNNSADQQGAAINLDGDDSIVSNCIFMNNNAYSGGAVYWSGDNGNFSGCSFVNNSASDGGALTFMGYKNSVSGCSFVNNSARLDGGAIYLDESDEGIVSDCSFVNNYADRQGGAISWRYTKDGVVFDCSFVDNSALDGGAIYLENYDNGNVSGSIFVNNRANYGIVYFDNSLYGHLSVNDNIFLNNDGVAIYFVDSDSTSDANYNWFGNNATNYDTEPVTTNAGITAWLFLNATANPDKIGIQDACDIVFRLYAYDSNGVSEYDGSRLKAVNLTVTPTNGRVNTTKTELGESVQFTAESSGIGEITASIENASYTISVPISDGTSFVDLNRTINGNDNDTIVLDNDYIYNTVFDYDLTGGIVIDRPVTIIGNGHTLNATGLARIFNIQADNVTIENITFANGKRDDDGGAIFWRGANGNVSGCTFVNNYAKFDGGAIYWIHGDDSIVSNCSFVDNSVQFDGAAMYYVASAGYVVSNCSFEKNSAVERGGAIYIYESNGCTVSDCSFVKNSASKYSGGAIYWDGHNANVSGCSFVDNSAKDDGGAIFLTYSEGSVVSDCSFVHNSASNHGGAIFWGRYANDGVVSDCSFVNNHANSNGGAIYWNSDKGVVSDCSFVHNTATKNAGALFWYANEGRVSGCIFVNNSAGDKSVIKFYNGENHNLSVNDNIFLNNNGVAISFVRIDSASNADYNWFGNNATNYDTAPTTTNVELGTWLFLNATVDPDLILVSELSEIIFELYSYNATGVSDYDDSQLYPINLTVTATNGVADGIAKLGETVKYNATVVGKGSVTAKIENVEYTTEIIIKYAPNLSVGSQEVIYSNNTVIALDYNSSATGKVNITLNGKKSNYTFTDLDLNGTVSLGEVDADEYDVIVVYSGDEIFFNATATGTLTVNKANSSLNVTNITFDYKDMGSGEMSFSGAIGVDAKIVNHDEAIVYVKGNTITVLNLTAGSYTLTVTTVPDANHVAVSKNATVTVRKINSTLNVNDIVMDYCESKNVTVKTEGATGVTAKINGSDVDVIEDYTIPISGLGAGKYTLTVTTLPDENHNPITGTATITVNKIPAEISLANETLDLKAMEIGHVLANLTPAGIGNLTYVSSDASVVTVDDEGNVKAIGCGNATITVSFAGNDNYSAAKDAVVTVTVSKCDTAIDVTVTIDENNVTISADVDKNATGFVKFDVSGAENYTLYVEVADGKAIFEDVLKVGEYAVNATYLGDGNYNVNSAIESFTIVGHVKKDTPISAIPKVDDYTVTIDVKVAENATGFVTIGILGQNFIVPVEDGNAVFTYDFVPATYTADVTYLGDNDFNANATIASFTVIEKVVELRNTKIDVDVKAVENDVTITAVVDSSASGLIEFNIEGKAVYVAVNNGKAVYNTNLPAKDYNVDVIYMGDSKFNANRTSKAFTVVDHIKQNITIDSDVVVDNSNVTITVTVDENATGFVKFTMNDIEVFAEVKDGKVVLNTILPVGNYTIAATYLGDDDFNEGSAEINFTVDEIPLKDTPVDVDVQINENNVTITVGVDVDATGFVKFDVSGAENYTLYVEVADGKAVLEDVLKAGEYTVNATYMGDGNYNMNSTIDSFTIVGHVKKDTAISAVPSVDGSTVSISVDVDEDATGYVAIGILGQNFIVPVDDGKAVFSYDFVPGTYSANIAYLGDDNFNNATTSATFTVIQKDIELKNTTIGVDVKAVENDVTITVVVDSSASGLVEFNIEGKAVYVAVNNGEAVYDVVLPAGDYNVEVTYMGDSKFNANRTSKAFTVVDHVKQNTTVVSDVVVDNNGVTITVSVDPDATGFVKFAMNGNELFAEINDGKAVLNTILPVGNYTVTATYLGDDDFNADSVEINFTVEEIPLKDTPVDVDIQIIENNVTIAVGVDVDATGFVKFDVSGAENYTLYVEVADGKAVLEDVLKSGEYTINATYMGDGNYNMNSTAESFTIVGHVKKDTAISAVPSVDGTTVSISIDVDKDATGYVAIGILGQNFIVPVEDGKAVFSYDFVPGTYSANIAYLGDDNFNNATTSATFTVIQKDTELKNTTIDVDVKAVENDVTITASVDSFASGLVEFNIEGKAVYVAVNNGKAVYSTNLPAGNYDVDVTYMGDSKFNANKTSAKFTVADRIKKNTTIDSDVAVDNAVVTITVSVDPDATGFVKFTMNDNELFAEVNDGKAIWNVVLPNGDYTVSATYIGDDWFNENTTSVSFSVNNNESDVNKTIEDLTRQLEEALANATKLAEDLAEANKTIDDLARQLEEALANATKIDTVVVDGVEYPVEYVNGTAVVNTNKTAPVLPETVVVDGKEYPIEYVNGTATVTTDPVKQIGTVIESEYKFTRQANDWDAGERGALFYAVLKDINGNPLANMNCLVAVNGPIYNVTTDSKGRFGVQINLARANTYTYALSFLGNDKYSASFNSTKLILTAKKTSISASNKVFKAKATKTISVTLKTVKNPYDGKTYLYKGKKITLKINGKTYTAKTNAKGVAKFTIKLTKKGKYAAKVSFAGDKTYKASSKSIKVTIK